MRRRHAVAVTAIASSVLVLALVITVTHGDEGTGAAAPIGTASSQARPGGEARGGAQELQEQTESTAERLDALDAARAAGTFGIAQPFAATPAVGWTGEHVVDATADDWEPAIATDPNAPYVYVLTTRYGQPKPCKGNCPSPYIALTISKDGGRTWGLTRPLCACKGHGQFDPIIEVVPSTGDVYSVFMTGFNVLFVRSTDHGETWSDPVRTYGNVAWNDKPVIAMSDNGRDVYVSFNGPTGGDPWLTQSHDRGRTWTQTKLVSSKIYYFTFDADVAPDGTVYFAESGIDYSSGSGQNGALNGVVGHHVFISRDRGRTWKSVLVDTVSVGIPCVAEGCSPDFYIGHDAISADTNGDLVMLYDGATVDQGPQRIFARRSTDGGRTWRARTTLSVPGEEATAPAVEQIGDGDVRAFYYQTANGEDVDAWNVWYRSSRDGGATWSAPVKISDASGGADYKNADGFGEVYGDYGEIGVTSTGKTIAAWGEGFSWTGPGGVWINRQV
jgi:hypothetical protein